MPLFRRKPVGKPGEWFYCVKHGTVEEAAGCRAVDRLGPYATRGEAEHALEQAQARNEEWEKQDRPEGGDPE